MKNPDKKSLGARIGESFRTRAWHVGAYSVFAAVVVIAIAVVINLVVNALPASATQIDMTESQLYTLSGQSEQVLGALDKDVTVYWIVQSGKEDATLQRILDKYAEFDHVTVTKVDPVTYPNFASQYTDSTVSDNSVAVVCGDRHMYVDYNDIWTYSDMDSVYNYYYSYGKMPDPDVFAGEEKLTSAIRYVTSEELPVAYQLSGHGETGLDDEMKSAVSLENVQLEDLSLLTVDAVPDDCDLLLLCGPTSDISETEKTMIETYLAGGGKMIVTTEYTETELPNLTALLAEYGLTLQEGLVVETDSAHYNYGYADLLLPDLGSHEIVDPLSEGGYSVLFPSAQALTVSDSLPDNLTVTSLLTTSSGAYLKTNLSAATTYDKQDGDATGPFVLGAAVEDSSSGAKLVVYTSTAFTQSQYNQSVSGANQDLFLNSVDWLVAMTDSISIHAKTITSDTISFSNSAASLVKIVFIFIIPLAFIGTGVVIFIRRRRR